MNGLTDAPLLRLLQLSSPALPIGAFAYSQGLEYAVSAGWVSDESSARGWLRGILSEAVARLDLPILARAYGAWQSGDVASAAEQSRFLLACRESRELVLEDQHLGQSLARVLAGHGIEAARPWIRDPDATFAVLYALAATAWQIPLRAALLGYAYTWAEAQTGALSRVLPLGQLAVQRILFDVTDGAAAAADLALTVPDDEIGSFSPSHALASILHETQYTRLFRS
ncbi:MAG TPA: urease accessory UreF family protein [Polyangiaceae bacterium]